MTAITAYTATVPEKVLHDLRILFGLRDHVWEKSRAVMREVPRDSDLFKEAVREMVGAHLDVSAIALTEVLEWFKDWTAPEGARGN